MKRLSELDVAPVPLTERMNGAVASSGFDAVVALGPENFQYLSGVWMPMARGYLDRQNLVIWPANADPVVIVGTDWEQATREASRIAAIRTYDERGAPPPNVIVDALADALRELSLEDKRVGIEGLRLPWLFHERLMALLPNVQLAPCDRLFQDLRAQKSPEELEILETLAYHTDVAVTHAIGLGSVGMTERAFAAVIAEQIMDAGASAVPSVLIGSGARACGLGAPTDKVMEPGDVVRIDLNSLWRGWYCDLGRMATAGPPTAQVQRDYAEHVAFKQCILDSMQVGISCQDIYRLYEAEAHNRRLKLFRYPYIGLGHSIGVNNDEFPKLNEGHDAPLREGMVMNVEPDTIGEGGEIHHVEDMVVMTSSGARPITWSRDWSAPTIPELGEALA